MEKKTKSNCTLRMCGTANIWTKGQVVIPKEIRDILWLNSWDSVSFILKDEKMLWILPNTSIDCLLEYIESEKDITLIK